jgi:hypothetical protein
MTQVPRPQGPSGGTAELKTLRVGEGTNQTAPADYFTEVADTPVAEPAVTAGT